MRTPNRAARATWCELGGLDQPLAGHAGCDRALASQPVLLDQGHLGADLRTCRRHRQATASRTNHDKVVHRRFSFPLGGTMSFARSSTPVVAVVP